MFFDTHKKELPTASDSEVRYASYYPEETEDSVETEGRVAALGDEAYTERDLSIVDSLNNESLYIGMTKSEVEEILGNPEDGGLGGVKSHAEGDISIGFRDKKVVFMLVQNGDRFYTTRKIGMDSNKEEIVAAYSNSTVNDEFGLSVYLNNNFDRLDTDDIQSDDEDILKNITLIDFRTDDETGAVRNFMVSDLLFAKLMK
jgi:hypothetical protein